MRCEKCSEAVKRINGCEEDSCEPNRWQLKGWSWQKCPVKLITRQSQIYIWAYRLLQLGKSPNEKGWLYESNKYLQAMELIDVEVKRLETEVLKQAKNRK